MRKAVIIGGGGHARVIASMVRGEPELVTTTPDTEDELLQRCASRDVDIYIGIGRNVDRQRIADKLRGLGARLPACVGAAAFVADDAQIGDATVLCPGSVVGAKAVLGFASIVNTLSSVDHDCWVGDYAQITAGVTLGGTVRIGASCFLGIKSAVIPGITLGEGVVVMAGALVTKDVPPMVMVGGAPAHVVRQL